MRKIAALKRALLALTVLAAMPAGAAEVELLETVSIPMGRYGQKWLSVYSKVRVQNLAYEKDIEFIFTSKTGQLTSAKASYLGPSSETQELWESFATLKLDPSQGLMSAEDYKVQVRYRTSGGIYALAKGDVDLQAGPILYADEKVQIAMPPVHFSDRGLPLTVVLTNLAYSKQVQVHLSCDQFASEKVQNLAFQPYFTYGYGLINSPTPAGFEIWSTWAQADCEDLSYYVSYEVAGQKHQDGTREFPYRSHRIP